MEINLDGVSKVNIIIINSNGEILVNQEIQTHEMFNLSNFPNGLYFVKVISDNFNETKKLIVIK